MAAPAVLARVVIAALKRYAPKYVGAALKVLGAIELADLARAVYREVFGGDDAHAQALAGYQAPGEAPPDLVAWMRGQLGARFDPDALFPARFTYVDEIPEEEILRELEASQDTCAADLTVNVLQQTRGACRRRKR